MMRIFAFFGVFLLAAAFAPVAGAEDQPRYVSVQGEGAVETIPDMAEITSGVTARAATARQALDASSAGMRRLMEALKRDAIADTDIHTSNFNISPWYDRPTPGQPRRIAGYQASNQVTVRIRDISRLGVILDAVVSAGANRVNRVRFGVTDPQPLRDEARRKAVADARRRATLYATSAGAKLGGVIAIEERGARVPRPHLMATGMVRASSVPVAPGTRKITASITVRFEME